MFAPIDPNLSPRRLAILAAPLALVAVALNAPAAQPEAAEHRTGISIGGNGIRIERRVAPRDVAPIELELAAYRSGTTVVLVASGVNASAGYTTRLTRGDGRSTGAAVFLRNTPPRGPSAAVLSPFRLTASLRAGPSIKHLTVRVGDRVHRVRIEDVPAL